MKIDIYCGVTCIQVETRHTHAQNLQAARAQFKRQIAEIQKDIQADLKRLVYNHDLSITKIMLYRDLRMLAYIMPRKYKAIYKPNKKVSIKK